MELISMTDFVLQQHIKMNVDFGKKESGNLGRLNFVDNVSNYAYFLKKPLTLGMFIPCDLEGNLLEKRYYPASMSFSEEEDKHFKEYEEAKERVLFEGFEIRNFEFSPILIHYKNNKVIGTFINDEFRFFSYYKTIEDLCTLKPKLTESTVKQLGL